MSSIDIRHFVDINIKTNVAYSVSSTREVTVLFHNVSNSISDKIYNNLYELQNEIGSSYATNKLYMYAKVYFEAGGVKLRTIYLTDLTSTSALPLINTLPDEQIVVAFCKADGTSTVDLAKTVCEEYNTQSDVDGFAIYGVNQKIFLGSIDYETFVEETSNYTDVENFALKVLVDSTTQYGGEMTIGAYLSKIDFYGINTVQDYAYTKELLSTDTQVDNLNALVEKVLSNNANVAVELANSVRNIGGNLTNGDDLVNKFALIVLHQTLSERVLNTMTQKIKGSAGITALYSTISQELTKYVDCGYLTTDKYWSDSDLTLRYNGKTYTLITQGTALTSGFKVTILPLSSLTNEDKLEHKAPLMYVIIADSYGIRKVTINGQVI